MDIRGIQIVFTIDSTSEDGFVGTLTKTTTGETRGPLQTCQACVEAAHAWANEPATVSPVPTETKSEAVAVQVESPVEKPPVVETKEASAT